MYSLTALAALIALHTSGTIANDDAPRTTMAPKVGPPSRLNGRQLEGLSFLNSFQTLGDTAPTTTSAISVSQMTHPGSVALPSPTGNPLQYPDDDTGDCADDVYIGHNEGGPRWQLANASYTFGCFDEFAHSNPGFDGHVPYDRSVYHFMGAVGDSWRCGFQQYCKFDNAKCPDLIPYPLLPGKNVSSKLGPSCEVTDHNTHYKATGWVVIQSMVNYNNYLQNIYDRVANATANVDPDMSETGPFFAAFGLPADSSATAEKEALTGVTALLGVIAGAIGIFTAGMGSALSAAIIGAVPAVSSTIASSAIAGATLNLTNAAPTDQMHSWWGHLKNAVEFGYQTYHDGIFTDGWVQTNSTLTQGSANHTLINIIDGGAWAGGDIGDYNLENATAQAFIEQSLYAQMAQLVWTQSDSLTPFISVWDGDCTDTKKLPKDFMAHWVNGQHGGDVNAMKWADVSTTVDGQCFSLLGAKPGVCSQSRTTRECCMWDNLPSGTNSALNGTAWSGLKLTDMIESAVGGWKLNNKVNGYDQADIMSNVFKPGFPRQLSDAGVVNSIPVCDYGKNPLAPGKNCPNTMGLRCNF